MKRADPFELTANKVTGGIALVVVALVLVGWAAGWFFSGPVAEPRLFVAYFDESAGIREGDAVRIQGRRAGYVTDVTVVQHEGKAQARVEFAIAPGTGSPWLKEMVDTGGVPSDSSIRIRPAGMRGRPQLVIDIGKRSTERIAVGEEWKNTRGASEEDTFSQWQEDINRARSQIADLVAFFDDDSWSNLTRQLSQLRDSLESADSNISSVLDNTGELARNMDDTIRNLDNAVANLRDQAPESPEGLRAAEENLSRVAAELEEVHRQLVDSADQVERMREESEAARRSTESEELGKAGRELRAMAARLRASMARAESDPSRAGDLPPSRFWRPYYHAGEPRRGTSIDQTPVSPPGEGIGVPKGTKDARRIK